MAEVNLKHVYKVYDGNVEAVSDVSFTVKDKEFMVLVGPSGCGKSTILRMIAGLEEITRGEIYIDGKCINQVSPKDRDIAMVFQNYALYPHLSVYDNMAFGLKLRHFSKAEIEERVQEAAEILDLKKYLYRKPKQLSGGQRQRVAVGRAIVRKPKVFLFDEPLSNLDAKLRVQMRSEITRLHKALDATMIYVTHDQVEAMTMGTRIALVKDGLLQQVDRPLKIYDQPANQFVAGFIGSPAMNFMEGSLRRNNEKWQFIANDFMMDIPFDLQAVPNPDQIILGIRPEDIYEPQFVPSALTNLLSLEMQLEMMEPLGTETYLYINFLGKHWIAKIRNRVNHSIGQKIQLQMNLDAISLFDKDSGVRILPA